MSFVVDSPIDSSFVALAGTDAAVRLDFLDGVDAALTAANWTGTDVYPTSTFTFSGLPPNGNNITVGGKLYTWQTVLTNSDGNVLIGGSIAACITNIIAAVNLGAGSGTLYAAATTANTAAQATASSLTTAFIATGIGATPYSNLGANTLVNGAQSSGYGGWSSSTLIGAGQSFLSPENADDFGQFRINTRINALATANNIFLDIATRDNANIATNVGIFGGNVSNSPGLISGLTYRMISSPTTFAIFLPGTYVPDGTTFFFNAPAIPEFLRGHKITNATNATPVVYTTSAAHGYTTGQVVFARYITGNTDANTQGACTVISPTTFSIAGSVGSGSYVSGGISWNNDLGQVGEVAVASGGASNGSIGNWRTTLAQNRNAWIINNSALDGGTSGRPAINYLANGAQTATGSNVWFNNNPFAIEPFVAVGSSPTGSSRMVGQMRNVAIAQVSIIGDTVPDPFDGHTWINITDQYGGATNQSPGGILWATS